MFNLFLTYHLYFHHIAVDEFAKTVNGTKEDFAERGPFAATVPIEEALALIEDSRQQFTALASAERSLRKGLAVFKIDQAPSKDLEVLLADLELLNEAWLLTKDWTEVWSHIKSRPFQMLEVEEMDSISDTYQRKITKAAKVWLL